MPYFDLRERVFVANREIVLAGLAALGFDNVSAIERSAGVIAIKPSGVPYDELCPESIVVVDLDSGRVVDGEYRPSADMPTHLVLYRRFATLGGVVHTHSTSATAWAQAGRSIPCLGTTHADYFYGSVPVTRALTSDEIRGDYERATGDVIVETIEGLGLEALEMPAVLVASHGPFAWGSDVEHAVENAVALETVAEMALHTMQLEAGLAAIEDDLLERHFLRKHGPGDYYRQDQ